MMDRAEKAGLGVAVTGHLLLFGLLSLSFLWSQNLPRPKVQPIDVSLVDTVALEAAAPEPAEQPAQSRAPEAGPPEDAPPPAAEEVAQPEPAPEPKPAPPEPRPEPVRQPKPQPQPRAAPPPKPAPQAAPKPPQKTAAKPDTAKATAKPAVRPAPPRTAAPAKPTAATASRPGTTKSTGANPNAAAKPKPRGSRLDSRFLAGLGSDPSPSDSQKPVAAKMSTQAAASIGAAIKRQVQPCADRQVNPGPGASDIVVTIRLKLNRDGSLNGRPTIAGAPRGVGDGNERYVDAVNRNAIAAFVGCAPLRGLPRELYDVPNGWNDFRMTYKLPG